MVVEDEELLRGAVATALRRAGFEVLEAANGSAAINLIRENGNIDAILLDATLPGPPIHDIIREAATTKPNVKVVLTSAYSPEMLTDAGVVSTPQVRDFLRKPFRLADLVHKLQSIVSS